MHGIHCPGLNPASAPGETQIPQPRLVRAAHEFEAQMMKELFKPMTEDDAEGQEESAGVLREFACEALGRGLSDAGGLGIADRIVQDLSRSGNYSKTAVVDRTGVATSHVLKH
jgi:Rod binding domain-containing protein